MHRFGGRHDDLRCVRSEHQFQSAGFGGVVDRGAGAVRIDVADLFRADAGILQRHADGFGGAFRGRLGDVVRVGRHAEADDFGDRFRAAGQGVVERLDGHHGGAFAQDHAVAILRERPAHAGRNDAHGFPRFQKPVAEGRFAAAGDGEIGHAGPNHGESLADGMRG